MRKRARTYRTGVDGCGAGTGRVATTSRTPRNDGFAARDDGYGSLKKIGRRRVRNTRRQVQDWATTGVARAMTAEIARQWVTGRATVGPTPRGRVVSTVYKRCRLVRDSCFD